MEAKFEKSFNNNPMNKLTLAYQKLKGGVKENPTALAEVKIKNYFTQITKDLILNGSRCKDVTFDINDKNLKNILTKLKIEIIDNKINSSNIVFTQQKNKRGPLGRYYLIIDKKYSAMDCFLIILTLLDFIKFTEKTTFIMEIDQFQYNYKTFALTTKSPILTNIFLKNYIIFIPPTKFI